MYSIIGKKLPFLISHTQTYALISVSFLTKSHQSQISFELQTPFVLMNDNTFSLEVAQEVV